MQPAISQAQGEINFLVLHGQGGEGACEVLGSRSWDLSDFRLQRLNPLPGLREGGGRGCCKPDFIISGSPNRGRRQALALKGGLFGNRGKAALGLGSQTLGWSGARKDSGRVRCTRGHMYVYTQERGHMLCHTSHRAWHRGV